MGLDMEETDGLCLWWEGRDEESIVHGGRRAQAEDEDGKMAGAGFRKKAGRWAYED